MKQKMLILFASHEVMSIKQYAQLGHEITVYLGTRLIDAEVTSKTIIYLNDVLPIDDMRAIQSIVHEIDGAIEPVFIAVQEDAITDESPFFCTYDNSIAL